MSYLISLGLGFYVYETGIKYSLNSPPTDELTERWKVVLKLHFESQSIAGAQKQPLTSQGAWNKSKHFESHMVTHICNPKGRDGGIGVPGQP